MALAEGGATRPTVEERIRAALWFAGQGFGIFSVWSATDAGTCRCPRGPACTSPGKHPITQKGFHDATRDERTIRTLLAAGSEPNYGLVNPDGVFTLDVDGPDWRATLASLEVLYGELPATLRTATANGQHIFLRWPDDVGPRPLAAMFGFVTRWGSGERAGYVIGPKSVHPTGAIYGLAAGAPYTVAVLPATWANAALRAPGAGTGDAAQAGAPLLTITAGYELPAAVAAGERYAAIVAYTAHLYNRNWSTKEMWGAVRLHLAPLFTAPLTETELRERFDRAVERMPQRLGAPRGITTVDPDTGEVRRVPAEDEAADTGLLALDTSTDFPPEPDAAAFEGLLGACVDDIAPGTDASRVGLLGSLLAFCGALIPTMCYFHRVQTSSPFIALVGESGIGRKGTAMFRAHDALGSHADYECIEGTYVSRVLLDGLVSGEGLVTALHYKQESFKFEPVAALVFEEEYASLLASRQRDGSTLDPKLRVAFDGGPLATRKSSSGESKAVVPPYWLPALIGITPSELRARIEAGAMTSGSANRWLYLPVRKRDGYGGRSTVPEFSEANAIAVGDARKWALGLRGARLSISEEVSMTVDKYAEYLAVGSHGLAGDLTRRYSVIALRIALVHASVEQSMSVTMEHLRRALALTEYARLGLPWVFGPIAGSADARLLQRHLVAEGGRLANRTIARSVIRDPIRRQDAVDELQRLGIAAVERYVPTGRGGRPRSDLVLAPGIGQGAGLGQFWNAEGGDMAVMAPARSYARARGDSAPDVAITPDPRTAVRAITPVETLQNPAITQPIPAITLEGDEDGEEPAASIGRRPDGTIWCYYWAAHSFRHRDVQSNPWCEICSADPGPADGR